MVASMPSTLESIISITDDFLKTLTPHVSGKSRDKAGDTISITPLELPDVDSQSLHEAFSIRPISSSLVSTLIQVFLSHSAKIHDSYQKHWNTLFTFREPLCKESLSLLKKASHEQFSKHVHELKQRILSVLDERLDKFNTDAEASAQSEFESSSEDGMLVARGHSRLAVKILEKAYSRTTNISRAEKVRLAAATKLEPRQVTIWVSVLVFGAIEVGRKSTAAARCAGRYAQGTKGRKMTV
jgi:hypothetical protein